MVRETQFMALRVLVVALTTLWTASFVHAEDSNELIRQGIERRRQRDDEGALRLFEQANELGHSARALAQMGLAEQALGRWVAASEHFRQALAASNDPWIAKNRPTLEDAVARVAGHVGWIEVLGGRAGAEVRLDGKPRGILPLSRPLATTTGTVVIDLVMPGRLPVRRTTSVGPGETTREAFDDLLAQSTVSDRPVDRAGKRLAAARSDDDEADGRLAAAAPATDRGDATPENEPDPGKGGAADAPAEDAHRSSFRTPLVIGTGVLSAAALIFAIVEHRSWYDKVSSFDRMDVCDPHAVGHGSPGCATLYSDAESARTAAFVGYGAAGLLAGTSVVLYFALDQGQPTASDHRVACSAAPGLRGLGCAFRF